MLRVFSNWPKDNETIFFLPQKINNRARGLFPDEGANRAIAEALRDGYLQDMAELEGNQRTPRRPARFPPTEILPMELVELDPKFTNKMVEVLDQLLQEASIHEPVW
jgi:hypothetical protein